MCKLPQDCLQKRSSRSFGGRGGRGVVSHKGGQCAGVHAMLGQQGVFFDAATATATSRQLPLLILQNRGLDRALCQQPHHARRLGLACTHNKVCDMNLDNDRLTIRPMSLRWLPTSV
jgi:hypothetical protein